MSLVDALNQVFEEYGYYKEGITNITLKGLDGADKIKRIMNFFRTTDIALPSFKILAKDDVKTYTEALDELNKKLITKSIWYEKNQLYYQEACFSMFGNVCGYTDVCARSHRT
jgi:phosphoglucomutase